MSSEVAAYGRILHARFLSGDATAFEEIYMSYCDKVFAGIEYKVRTKPNLWLDLEIAKEAVNSAFMSYFENPGSFDPEKSALLSYLKMAAYGDYVNEWIKERRKQNKIVEIRDAEGNTAIERIEDDDTVDDVAERNAGNLRGEAFMRALSENQDELMIVNQMIEGMKDTQRCIVELGWPDGRQSVQRLYKERDKLKKRFKRNLPKLLGDDQR